MLMVLAAAATLAAVSPLAGCTSFGSGGDVSGLTADYGLEPEVVLSEPTETEIQDSTRATWDCFYDPSINENWHDDVVCHNGVDSFRPILLPDSGFVTEDEMSVAGDGYERELNAASISPPS